MGLKSKYNRWLYKKYSLNIGGLFEKIPLIFKLNPLFSPSLYINEGTKIFSKSFEQGFKQKVSDSNENYKARRKS